MQQELFKAQTAWFHVFKSMVQSGDVAAMGPGATTVYLVIKAYTNWQDGRSFPSQKIIAEKTGMNDRTVRRHLKTLADFGYLNIESGKLDGRNNRYTLREKIVIRNSEDEPAAVATWDYLPSTVKAAVAEIRNLALKGDFDGVQLINIERLEINIGQLGLAHYMTQFQSELKKLPLDLQTAIKTALSASHAQSLAVNELKPSADRSD